LDHSKPWSDADPVVVARDVCKSYDGRPVLRGVSFTLRPGERLALVDRPDSGSIRLHGDALETLSSDGLARLRRQRVGTIFQFFHLLPTLTAAENVEFPLQLLGTSPRERTARVQSLLERVGVAHRAHALPSQLSGGEMQRVAIARALVHRPDLILADEPTGNLDSTNGENVLALLRELGDETGVALVLVTHSLPATRICHRVIHLRDGHIERDESNLR